MLLLLLESYHSLLMVPSMMMKAISQNSTTENWMPQKILSNPQMVNLFWQPTGSSMIYSVSKTLCRQRNQNQQRYHRLNNGDIPVAVIHPASAGHGLNLQAGGSTLIWFGLTWSLELYQQTNARLWRQGQSSGTVVIEHIIAKEPLMKEF